MSDTITTSTDPKEACLHAILNRLQDIDMNNGTRGNFVGGITFQMMNGMDKPIFEQEINLIRLTLGMEPIAKKDESDLGPAPAPREFQLGDL